MSSTPCRDGYRGNAHDLRDPLVDTARVHAMESVSIATTFEFETMARSPTAVGKGLHAVESARSRRANARQCRGRY